MDGLKVLEIIKKINPWFKTNQVPQPQLESFHRRDFYNLEKDLKKLDMATLIIGARRVGKSVLMYQLIDSLLKSGVDGKRILFIQGDNPILTEYAAKDNLINYILDLYQKYIIDKTFDDLTAIVYIFLDEAQNLSAWETEIKTIIDQKYKIKFIVTGSSSFELRRGSQNPLTGRVSIQPIFPFSFSDYARYHLDKEEQNGFEVAINKQSSDFKIAFMDGNLQQAYVFAKKAEKLIDKYNLKKRFENFLFYGGFPWVIANKDGEYTKYLRDILTTTISKDIMTQVEIRDAQSFERLMVNLCLMTGSITRYKTFAEALGIDERSVTKYIDYYVESHWAFISSPYVFHTKPDSVKTEKKVYVIDSGVINTLSFKDETDFKADRAHRGHVLENVIHNHLLAYKQLSIGTFQSSISFWIESEKNREIDFIYEIKSGGVIPIEVKQKISHDGSDSAVITEFLEKRSSAKFGIVTTEDTLQINEKILSIPALLLTLLL